MEKIIFATGNKGKLVEIKEILDEYEIVSMKEAGFTGEIDETGNSFEENAMIKARSVWKQTGGLVLADDSGLCVDALNGEPGIYSARYMGEDTPYSVKNAEIIKRLEGVSDKERTARFVCAVAAVFPDGSEEVVTGYMEGFIGHEIVDGPTGFGYDPIFVMPDTGIANSLLTMEEKNEKSHRGSALRQMKKALKKQ